MNKTNKIIFIIGILFTFLLGMLSTNVISSLGMKNHKILDIELMIDQGYIPGELIIKLNQKVHSDITINALNEIHQIKSCEPIFDKSYEPNFSNFYLIKFNRSTDIFSLIDKYSNHPNIEYAELNYVVTFSAIPNDPEFIHQWGLDNIGQNEGTNDVDIDAPEAWNITKGSSEVVIAIIDSGIDLNHPDLIDNIWVNEEEIPENNIDDDQNGYIDDVNSWNFFENNNDVSDIHCHGTHCAGIACAVGNNNQGISGTSWNSKIMPVRIAGGEGWDTTTTLVSEGIVYASDNGADVISMSFGWYNPSQLVKDALDYAYEQGIVLVACAHNHGVSDKNYPAAYDNVIGVAGINRNNERMRYYYEDVDQWVVSNYGSWVDVAAPSQEIFSTMPTYEVTYNGLLGLDLNYALLTGNSMAVPCVAGVCGLLLSKDSTLSPESIKFLICNNVDPYSSSYDLGSGRINAFKVLTAPNTPSKPAGPSSGKVGEQQIFTTITTDDENDRVFYMWDWGDGNFSEWLGPYKSGETCEASYNWEKETTYNIAVKAKDENEGTSDWSEPVSISIPKNKPHFNTPFLNFLQKFLENHPILYQLFQRFLRL